MQPTPIAEDMAKLKTLLHDSLSPHLSATQQKDMRILNLACGRCDEAETLIKVGSELTKGGDVEMIGADIRLDPVNYIEGKGVKELLTFYMGKNTPDRQEYIIENLREDVDRQIAVPA